MHEMVIARKYARALASSFRTTDEILNSYKVFLNIEAVFSIPKFRTIISSYNASKARKLEILMGLLVFIAQQSSDSQLDSKTERLLSLMVKNDRIALIPFVSLEIKKILDLKQNVYVAVLYVKESINSNTLQKIEMSLGKKLGVTLQVTQRIDSTIEGIRLDIPDLNIEIAFLRNRFIHELQEFILKAI